MRDKDAHNLRLAFLPYPLRITHCQLCSCYDGLRLRHEKNLEFLNPNRAHLIRDLWPQNNSSCLQSLSISSLILLTPFQSTRWFGLSCFWESSCFNLITSLSATLKVFFFQDQMFLLELWILFEKSFQLTPHLHRSKPALSNHLLTLLMFVPKNLIFERGFPPSGRGRIKENRRMIRAYLRVWHGWDVGENISPAPISQNPIILLPLPCNKNWVL